MTFLSNIHRLKPRVRLLRWFIALLLLAMVAGSAGVAGLYLYLEPKLPEIDSLRDVRMQVPLRVYSRDEKLIAEFGEMKRTPLGYEQLPEQMVQAILAAEDNRFFEHPGVDYQGLLRAAIHLVRTGERGQGGSTITMQLARNFFLSREKTYTRKLNEILLSLKIEQQLSKEEILELYLNKIYLGKRAYGVAAAAHVYYGRELNELTLPQLAMIAGLPKAPSAYNPVNNPERALQRRNYVLRRMHELGYITDNDYTEALQAPVSAAEHSTITEMEAPYLAEMVRAEMVERYGEEAYTSGYRVITTVDSRLQQAANRSMHDHLMAYEQRHGYRGAEKQVELEDAAGIEEWQQILKDLGSVGGLDPALVVALSEQEAVFALRDGTLHTLTWAGMEWASPYINENATGKAPEQAADILSRGDIIRVEQDNEGRWQLVQLPQVAAALVSLNPTDGALLAISGGFDFFSSKFNRATQAERQPGSNFKPFIYSAALDNGFTPASIINDAPVVFADSSLESEWRPENYSGRFYGPTRLREALVNSRNLVSIRLLQSIGISTAINYVGNFGFSREQLPRDLSLSLGSATLTPYEVARGYATFANGGFLIEPYFIQRIEDREGQPLYQANPALACDQNCREQLEREQQLARKIVAELFGDTKQPPAHPGRQELPGDAEPEPRFAPRTVEARNVYLIRSIMEEVIRRGTGRRALQLGRDDLAGKTGTTNEQHDAWFSGFNNDVVTTVWVGFDTPQPLGNRETGSRAALPMWIDYMREALKDKPEHTMSQPEGLVSVRIDAETGLYSAANNPNAMFELFREENAPQPQINNTFTGGSGSNGEGTETITEELF